jgi:riboflavin kinase
LAEETVVVEGRYTSGLGVGAKFIAHPYYAEALSQLLGCKPHPGTLNIVSSIDWRELASNCEPIVIPETVWDGRRLGAVYVWRARIRVDTKALDVLLIRPLLSKHDPEVLELVSCSRLRDILTSDHLRVEVLCRIDPYISETILGNSPSRR